MERVSSLMLKVVVLLVLCSFGIKLHADEATDRLKENIQDKIAKANYCKEKADCAGPIHRCPFGCFIYVNKAEIERIKKLMATFPEECVYKCQAMKELDCVKGKCEVFFE